MHQLSKIKDTRLEFQPIILRWTVFFPPKFKEYYSSIKLEFEFTSTAVQKSEENPTMDLEGGFDSPGKKKNLIFFY